MVAQTLLKLHTVAVGHGHIVHVHTEHQAAHVLGIGHTGSHAGPNGYLLLGLLVLPVAAHHLAGHAHTGADVSELDVAVGTLVQVHEVHVHGFPGYLGVVLGVEVEQGLLQGLQTLDPHLGGREGVHPGDDAHALVVVVGGLHHGFHFLAAVGGAFVHHLDGDDAAVVQSVDHLFRMGVNGHHGVASVEELCACYPPNLVILKCFYHNRFFI